MTKGALSSHRNMSPSLPSEKNAPLTGKCSLGPRAVQGSVESKILSPRRTRPREAVVMLDRMVELASPGRGRDDDRPLSDPR